MRIGIKLPASTVALCATPDEESLYKSPFDKATSFASEHAVVVAVIGATAALPVLVVVAVNKEPAATEPAGRPAIWPMLVSELVVPTGACAEATGADATESIPANSAVVAVSAMRLRSVVFDICFLSLVRIRNFLNLARRSFDLLIPFPCGTHV